MLPLNRSRCSCCSCSSSPGSRRLWAQDIARLSARLLDRRREVYERQGQAEKRSAEIARACFLCGGAAALRLPQPQFGVWWLGARRGLGVEGICSVCCIVCLHCGSKAESVQMKSGGVATLRSSAKRASSLEAGACAAPPSRWPQRRAPKAAACRHTAAKKGAPPGGIIERGVLGVVVCGKRKMREDE